MQVLVINPMTRYAKNVVRDVLYGCWCRGKRIGGGTVPPFALLQVATVLKGAGHDVTFMDAQAQQVSFESVCELAPTFQVVVISTSTMTFREDVSFLQGLKEKNPSLTTLILGSQPTFLPESSLAHPAVDIAVRREPEYVIRDVLAALEAGGNDWQRVNGIAYKNGGDANVINPEYPFIKNLDELPFPDVTMLPKDADYFNPLIRHVPYVTATTSRGCPAKCTFCTAPYFHGTGMRFQSADYVIEQIKYFLAHGYREIYFRDDTFFVNKLRDQEICERIIGDRIDVTWLANGRIKTIDKDTMKLAKRAGCHTIKFGVESGVQEILENINKDHTLEQAREVFRWVHEIGMHTHTHTMLGCPGDTRETVMESIRFTRGLDPTTASFAICTPYPGTPMFEMVREKCPEIGDGTGINLENLHLEGFFNEQFTSLSREELGAILIKAYRSFYLRPHYWMKSFREQLTGWNDVMRIAIAASNVLDFAVRGE